MMHKRIILFVLGLAVAVGIFWAYQALTGSSFLLSGRKPPLVLVSPLDKDRPLTVEMRRPDGGLVYVLNAKKADPTKDAAGVIIQGQYTLTEPSASYHTSDERLVVIRADTGTLSIDQLGTAAKPRLVPRGGKLSGNVVLTIGPKESFYDNNLELRPGQIQARLEKDLEFDYNDRVLSSSGAIQVRGDRVAFDGKKMTLAFNMDDKRIEFLRIDEGNKIIIKNIGAEGFGLKPKENAKVETQTTKPVATAPAEVAATGPALKPVASPTTYKLSFGKDVKASVGGNSLTSEHLYVLFMVATSQMAEESGKPAKEKKEAGAVAAKTENGSAGNGVATTAKGATTMIAGNPAATQVVIPPVPAFPKEGEDDLVVTWTGPMEMRPSGPTDLVLTGPRDAALEAVGTVERPVVMKDGTGSAMRSATAGRMWYHVGEQRLELEKGDLSGVQFSDPTLGNAKCAGMTFVQTGEGTSTIKLAGPGSVEVLQAAIRRSSTPAAVEAAKKLPPVVATWGKEMALDLVTVVDGKGKNSPMVKRGVLTGNARVADASFSLSAKDLEFAIAATGDAKTPAAFERMVATGDVQVRVSRNGSGLEEKDKPDGLNAREMVLSTTVGTGSKVPVVSEMLATGDVVAWNYTEEKGSKKLNRQQITTPKLDVFLAAREGNATAAGADNFGGSQVKQMVASDGVKVELEGFGGQGVVVTAQTLTADPRDGKAVLEGVMQPNGVMRMARLQQGENQIVGAKMLLDQKGQSLEIPGEGSFVFVQPGQKAGEAGTPVQVSWSKSMSYNGRELLATFNGVVKAEMLGKADQYSEMTCDEILTVKLGQEKGEAGAGADAVAGGKVRLSEIVAKGNVKAQGASLDENKKPITRVYMQAPKLVYTEATKTMSIPSAGSLLVEDYRVDPKARPEGKGQTAFAWNGSLTYVGTSGEITFKKDVRMVHVPAKPFKMAGGAIGAGDEKSGAKGGEKAESQRIDLNCDALTAVMVASKEAGGGNTVASPVALGSGGNQKLSKVTANGGAVLTMGDKELSAAELEFDAVGQKAVASGKDGSWATFSSGGNAEGRGEADQIIWEMGKDNAVTLIRPRGNVTTN